MTESVDYTLAGGVEYMRRPNAAVAAGSLGKLLTRLSKEGVDCEFFLGCRAAGAGDGDFAVFYLLQDDSRPRAAEVAA